MKLFHRLFMALSLLVAALPAFALKYAGGDISLLPEYDKATYYAPDGSKVPDFLTYCADQGMNAMRVRLFVNPQDYNQADKDANAKQDLAYIIPICKRIKEAGCALMLDFHYSDTWADPLKQWTPKQWESLSDQELYQRIYDYTGETLRALKAEGIEPDLIQPGNEISYGMLWGPYNSNSNNSSLKKANPGGDGDWNRFTTLLSRAIEACREECPDAKIIIHMERVAKPDMVVSYYNNIKNYGVDYDIIGLSYYPYFHGNLNVLETAINRIESNFPGRDIMIVETGYSYEWSLTDNPVSEDYPRSQSGQAAFTADLVSMLDNHPSCKGIFWWWMEYNAYGTSLSGWYNAALIDSRNGKISPALALLAAYADGTPDPEKPDPVDPDPDDSYPDFYLVYNNASASWSYPGTKFTHTGNGIYTLSNVYIGGENNTPGWFTLATSSDSWSEVEATRHGPAEDSQIIQPDEYSEVVKGNQTSWQTAAGYYNLMFDYPEMQLLMTTVTDGISALEEDCSETPVYFNLQGVRVNSPERGIFIRISGSRAEKVVL